MSQQPNERVTRERIEKAGALAKKGQYQKARYMLSELHANPRAAKLLKQMEGRDDKFQGNVSSFFNVTAVVILVLGIIVVFVAYNLVTDIRGQTSDRDAVYAAHSERGIQANAELYVDLVYFCYDRLGATDNPACLDWGQTVITSFSSNVRSCVIVADGSGIQYRNQELANVESCFIENGIPALPS